jgi:hypothetical protein
VSRTVAHLDESGGAFTLRLDEDSRDVISYAFGPHFCCCSFLLSEAPSLRFDTLLSSYVSYC